LDQERHDRWLQQFAAEMNQSETAFLRKLDGPNWSLRWFTPLTEVRLCGHATLASAHTLWSEGHATTDELCFQTLSGELRAHRADGRIWLNFPLRPVSESAAPEGLAAALGVEPRFVGQTEGATELPNILVDVGDAETVVRLAPDFAAIAALPVGGVIVTAAGGPEGADFVSRYFDPKLGIPEDPVTGSAHCSLGAYWRERLEKNHFTAYQASQRGGWLEVVAEGDRVRLGGRAVTVVRGELAV
jgi:PhzF family phenazine biosynthesis protein